MLELIVQWDRTIYKEDIYGIGISRSDIGMNYLKD